MADHPICVYDRIGISKRIGCLSALARLMSDFAVRLVSIFLDSILLDNRNGCTSLKEAPAYAAILSG